MKFTWNLFEIQINNIKCELLFVSLVKAYLMRTTSFFLTLCQYHRIQYWQTFDFFVRSLISLYVHATLKKSKKKDFYWVFFPNISYACGIHLTFCLNFGLRLPFGHFKIQINCQLYFGIVVCNLYNVCVFE